MNNPEHKSLPRLDFRGSCTKDEAVAKMLHPPQGPIDQTYIGLTPKDIPAVQLRFTYSRESSLEEQLMQRREAAIRALRKAAEGRPPMTAFKKQLDTLVECEELIRKAVSYLIDIDDELAKGKSSALRIDKRETKKTGVTHITLKSLDQWANKEHGISIFDRPRKEHGISINDWPPLNPVTENSPERQEHQQENESAPKGGLGRIAKESLYTTFAFLIEAFSKTATKYRHEDGRPNATAIAKHLAPLAIEVKGPDSPVGQGEVSIGDRIEDALRIKRKKYPRHK